MRAIDRKGELIEEVPPKGGQAAKGSGSDKLEIVKNAKTIGRSLTRRGGDARNPGRYERMRANKSDEVG